MLKIPTIFFLITLSVLAVIHYIALQFFLYWKFWWFDIIMHGLGGAAIALGIYTLYDLRFGLPERLRNLIPILLFTMVIALLWEIFEIYIGIPIEDNYEVDTIVDLLMALVGATIGFFVGQAINKL